MKLQYSSKIILLAIMIVISLSSCSVNHINEAVDQENANKLVVTVLPTSHDQQALVYKNIVLGKIAKGRQHYKQALEYYIAALEITTDIELARDAIALSEQLNQHQSSIKIAQLWINQQPDALLPWKLVTFYAMLDTQIGQTQIGIEKILSLETSTDELFTFFKRLSNGEKQTKALQLFQSLSKQYPENPAITLTIAYIHQQRQQWPQALTLTAHLVKSQPDLLIAWKSHGSLLVASGVKDKAVNWYQRAVKKFSDSNDLQYQLGQALYSLDRFFDARAQFEHIIANTPNDSRAKYMIAASYYSEHNFSKSIEYFEPLLRIRRHRNSALFYLGEMAREQSNINTAISYYRQITNSRYYQTAHMLVARLMQQQGKQQQSLEYLNSLQPNDEDLEFRYIRALMAAEMGDTTLAETDLRFILKSQPEHVDALNALGYTLADANKSLPEALQMIKRAYEKKPSSPAIVDSMGWVLFRLGEFQKALEYLQQAYKLDQSNEIASHLGEVLWNMDKKQQARKVFSTALIGSADNKVVLDTMKKLNIQLKKSSSD